MLRRSVWCSLVNVSLAFGALCAPAQAGKDGPRFTGIAHVAIRVADLAASQEFYRAIGFTQPFTLTDKDGKVTEVFVKMNDRQYLELYPSDAEHEPGFLHVCWEAHDLEGLYPILTASGVVSPPVRKAGAGNMLMAWKGPEEQTVEITEYMPGSRHSNDFGKDLGPNRIADTLVGAIVPVPNPQEMAAYFTGKMGFHTAGTYESATLVQPAGAKDAYFGFATASAPAPLVMIFRVASAAKAQQELKAHGMEGIAVRGAVMVKDPDGNVVEFTAALPGVK